MTRTYRVTDIDIKRACSYITEDKAVADYFHVDINRVRELRKKVTNTAELKAERAQKRAPMPTTAEEQRMRANAKQGSDALLLALLKFFEKREKLQKAIAQGNVTA
jgi:hypothetical protein